MSNLTYSGAHARVRRIRGEASGHSCCHCGDQAQEWAYKHTSPIVGELTSPDGRKYSGDPDSYQPMCFRCHRLYDKAAITNCPHGHEYSEENTILDAGKRKCKTCVYKRNRDRSREIGLTPEQRKRKSDLQRERRAAARREAA